MRKHYSHLTQKEQYQIYSYKKAGFANELIAQELDRDVSTIKKELHAITFDNGKEFSYHEKIAKTLNVDTYFAHP